MGYVVSSDHIRFTITQIDKVYESMGNLALKLCKPNGKIVLSTYIM